MEMPHTVRLHSDETKISFASRLALANKLPSLPEFLKDFGFTFVDARNGDATTLTGLAKLGGVDVSDLTDQMFRPSGKSRFRILGFEVEKQHLLLDRNRICPACFRADIGDEMTEETVSRAYARILWSFSSVRTCPIHLLLLATPPEDNIKYEFATSWEPWLIETSMNRFRVAPDSKHIFRLG